MPSMDIVLNPTLLAKTQVTANRLADIGRLIGFGALGSPTPILSHELYPTAESFIERTEHNSVMIEILVVVTSSGPGISSESLCQGMTWLLLRRHTPVSSKRS